MTPNVLRGKLMHTLGIPQDCGPLAAEHRGDDEFDGVVIERWVWTSEVGSRVPAVLYRPATATTPMPAVVLTFGHGGSKSQWQYNYAGQLYARLGIACLGADPLGEEERHLHGQLGTRAHDVAEYDARAMAGGRPIMGKLVLDSMRAVDFLFARNDIDTDRIGVAGNSLGGAKATWMLALEPRLKAALVCGWAWDDLLTEYGKCCTRTPFGAMRTLCDWPEFLALAAPHCAVLAMNGDADTIIDRDGDGTAWQGIVRQADAARALASSDWSIDTWFEASGGHRPYFAYKDALLWLQQQLGTPGWSKENLMALPTVNSGSWCDQHGVALEPLYGTDLHQRGATLVDLNIRPTPRALLRCLDDDELGQPDFTIEGWLETIA